jgi:hypothetical protein
MGSSKIFGGRHDKCEMAVFTTPTFGGDGKCIGIYFTLEPLEGRKCWGINDGGEDWVWDG